MLSLARPAAAQISVGANIHVSRLRDSLVHDEVMIGADPRDSNKLVACSIARAPGRYALRTIAYATADGGHTWMPTAVDSSEMAGDPVCVYGATGKAFFISVPYGGKERSVLNVFRSVDGGQTWLSPTKVPRVPDRPAMAVDQSGGKYDGRVYIAYNASRLLEGIDRNERRSALALVSSSDGGATFTYPVLRGVLDDKNGGGWPLGAEVLSDGTVVILYRQRFDTIFGTRSALKALTSTDGGATLSPAVPVADIIPRQPATTTWDVTSTAVDASSGPFKDRVYVVWSDNRSGRSEAYIVYSADKGKTWSKPRAVNDDRPWPLGPDRYQGPNHTTPEVAVNNDGIVGVMWYDRRDHPDDVAYDVRFSASLDGGETWLPSIRVSEKPMATATRDDPWAFDVRSMAADSTKHWPISLAVTRSEWVTGGHTAEIATRADGVFFPLWVDDRTGRHQVWTAPVTVTGRVVKNGAPELAALDDISAKVTVELTYAARDRAKGLLTVTARLKNISKDTIRGPVKVRAIALSSKLASVSIANADNALTGPGAVWDFTTTLPGGRLLPDSVGGVRTLVFRCEDMRPSNPVRDVFVNDVLSLDVRALGERRR
jgi:hypothetical protein